MNPKEREMKGGEKSMQNEDAMQRVTTKQAAAELNMDLETLQYLMRKERLPIGYAMRREGKKRSVYIIYRGLLDQFKKTIQGEDNGVSKD